MRKILTAILVVFVCQLAAAQGRLGLKAGTNYYFLKSNEVKTLDYSHGRPGWTVGASYELLLNKNFAIQPELNYSFGIARESYYGSKIKMGYTQVPVLLRYAPTSQPVAFLAGPQVSFLSNANTKTDAGKEMGVRGQMNQTDFGYTLGVAYAPTDNKNGWTVDLRVYQGVMNVFKAEYDNGAKTRNNLVSLTVGYLFKK